ncbi:DDE transposase family protein [Pseudanabaena sp. FACHB-2040]|uniref:DDE transposase family protein n=1 Tax=Pseudanabaena sp. FACHB-2040 TaxID=2692859 RepID=UPI0016899D68|nr:DDE transposase family protein [Pseudanabaena sp. FACHB-2040]MBD2257855.1 DDE transposase family protein [Pseudanabaena sp. FACHB-2040]
MSETAKAWYIVQTEAGHCSIMTADQIPQSDPTAAKQWGPFVSEAEAVARRVGLIRSGKCKPV